MSYKKIPKKILNYFMQGLLYLAPISITIYVIYSVFIYFNDLSIKYVEELTGLSIPGLGILITFAGITIIGILGSSIIFRPLSRIFDKTFRKAPLIKIIYSSVKDLFSAFVGQKKKFNEPVLVMVNKESNLQKLGFVTNRDLEFLGVSKGNVAVYMPHSYAFSGNMFIVPAENVSPVNASSTEIMKFIISAGVTNV